MFVDVAQLLRRYPMPMRTMVWKQFLQSACDKQDMHMFQRFGTHHAIMRFMATPARVTDSLKRLCDLERGKGTLSSSLSNSEKLHEINRLRSILPAFILGHHDRKIQMGKASIVSVVSGVCSACHLRLPTGHAARLQSSQDLEVCDNCGSFIYLEPGSEPAPAPLTISSRRKRRAVTSR